MGFLSRAVAVACVLFTSAAGLTQAKEAPDLPPAIAIIHHPGRDEIDPFGYLPDIFADRYAGLASTAGSFDYPTLVADGVVAIRSIPNPDAPMVSTLAAYEAALRQRADTAAPVTLEMSSHMTEGRVDVELLVHPHAGLEATQPQRLEAWVALVEDNVHRRTPAPVSNGIENHRFTLRTHEALGPIRLDGASTFNASFELQDWNLEQVRVVAWIQADGSLGRFEPQEVVQAAQAGLGQAVRQESKVVLLQLYSATWCDPCLYGDKAVEQIAIRAGAAEEAPGRSVGYLEEVPVAAGIAALAAGGLAWRATRRRP